MLSAVEPKVFVTSVVVRPRVDGGRHHKLTIPDLSTGSLSYARRNGTRRYSSKDLIIRKYNKAAIRRTEYRKLKAIVPSVSGKKTVSKLTVIEEAIRYIDELHAMLADRFLQPTTTTTNSSRHEHIDLLRQRCHRQFAAVFHQQREDLLSLSAMPYPATYDVNRPNEYIASRRSALSQLQLPVPACDSSTNGVN